MPFVSKKIIILDRVDSTNNYAMAMIQKGEAINGNAVFALEQTHGKGRRGKQWESRAGENIILSVIAQMQWQPISRQFELSVAAALACDDFISKYYPAGTSIKWPNDVFINDSKAGGILIENLINGTLWQWSVIGIGININQEVFEKYNLTATSLKRITGQEYNVLELAKELQRDVLKRIADLQSGHFSKMLKEYNGKLYGRGRIVKLKKENIVFETKIIGVSASGQLITLDAMERYFNFDEVEFKGFV